MYRRETIWDARSFDGEERVDVQETATGWYIELFRRRYREVPPAEWLPEYRMPLHFFQDDEVAWPWSRGSREAIVAFVRKHPRGERQGEDHVQ